MQRAERAKKRRSDIPGSRWNGSRSGMHFWLAAPIAALTAAFALGCGDSSNSSSNATASGTSSGSANATAGDDAGTVQPVDLVARGRSVYSANCIACHAVDPAQDGSLGPAVAGSSLELLEARVLHAEYPEGYTPKRTSGLMVAMPHLERELEALHAYLNAEG